MNQSTDRDKERWDALQTAADAERIAERAAKRAAESASRIKAAKAVRT